MKNIKPNMKQHIGQQVSTLATCWLIVRKDGTRHTITDSDESIVFDGETYVSRLGFNRSALESKNSLEVANLEVFGVIDDAIISVEDIEAGRLDYASIDVFLVNWADPDGFGKIPVRSGTFGEVRLTDSGMFVAELRGNTQPYSQILGEVYTPECRATFGDHRCKVDVTQHQMTGAVVSASTRAQFTVDVVVPEDFNEGICVFQTGRNAGKVCEISHTAGDVMTLKFAAPLPIEAGDEFLLTKGCDKRTETCKGRYSNIINFRGEPFLPGQKVFSPVRAD